MQNTEYQANTGHSQNTHYGRTAAVSWMGTIYGRFTEILAFFGFESVLRVEFEAVLQQRVYPMRLSRFEFFEVPLAG